MSAARPGIAAALTAGLALPAIAALTVPVLVLLATRPVEAAFRPEGPGWLAALGAGLLLAGLALFAVTVAAFWRIGRGTLAPWAPPRRLVLVGPYRHMRHPMITGVLLVLVGEACILGSPWLGAWAGLFLAVNALYLPLSEEPGLLARFGEDYARYRRHVPRWLPRLRSWEGAGCAG